jgi:hypothetical protein
MERHCQFLKFRREIFAAKFANALRAEQSRPKNTEGNGLNVISGCPSRAKRSNQAARAGAGDEVRLEAVTFQRSENADVRQPAKAASAKGQTKRVKTSSFR